MEAADRSCPMVREACEGADIGLGEARAAQEAAKADKPKGYDPRRRVQESRRRCPTFVDVTVERT
jgi:hypothetical protein